VSRIERWTRSLLETEARKRGVRDAERRSRTELLRAIFQHDYGTRQSLRNARRLVTTLIDTANAVLPLFGSHSERQERQERQERPRMQPAASQTSLHTPAHAAPPAPPPQLTAASTAAPEAAAPSRIASKRHRAELQLSWQVNDADAERARTLLGHHGELALRVVTVRADPAKIVKSEITEHGPLTNSGAWTLLLPAPDAKCVSAIGVRHGERFVSIVHDSSRATS
jgi:hypothetical protein